MKTNKHIFTQTCHIKEIVTKHAILQCLSIQDQCMSILWSVWMCYTKCLNHDAGKHMYELCVCALTPCKRMDVKIYLWRFSPLEDDFGTRRCSSPFKLPFFKEYPKQQLIQIWSVLQWNQANTNHKPYNLPFWLFHGKTSTSPYNVSLK